MSTKAKISLSLFSFLVSAFFILALAENGYSGIEFAVGCCTVGDSCVGCESGCAISSLECQAGGGTGIKTDLICVDKGAGADCVDPSDSSGCCEISAGECLDEQIDYFTCTGEAGGIAWFESNDCSEVPQCSESPSVSNIPTLGEWGMIALAAVLVLAGVIYFTRRRRMTSV